MWGCGEGGLNPLLPSPVTPLVASFLEDLEAPRVGMGRGGVVARYTLTGEVCLELGKSLSSKWPHAVELGMVNHKTSQGLGKLFDLLGT